MIYNPPLSIKQLKRKLSKLKPLSYNRFWWWRGWKDPNKPLGKKQPLIDKIKNGDFDYSHYIYQAQLIEHEINKIYEEYYPNIFKINEKIGILRTRRNKLMIDFEKDEKDKLSKLIQGFSKNFNINIEQVEKEMLEFSGNIEKFYYIMCNNYYSKTLKNFKEF